MTLKSVNLLRWSLKRLEIYRKVGGKFRCKFTPMEFETKYKQQVKHTHKV